MKLKTLNKPFPHVLFKGFCSEEELKSVLYELKALSLIALPPDQTGAAWTKEEGSFKNNSGVFLTDLYRNQNVSSIYRVTRKLFDKTFMKSVEEFNLIFRYLSNTNEDGVLIQFYEEGGFYKKHTDLALYTAIIKIDALDSAYEGGDLRFPDHDYSIDLKHNSGILFPSFIPHEVAPVKVSSSNKLNGRITIAVFASLSMGKYAEESRRAYAEHLRGAV